MLRTPRNIGIVLAVVGAALLSAATLLMLGVQCRSGITNCPLGGCAPLPACPSVLDYAVSLALFSVGCTTMVGGGASILGAKTR